MCESKLEKLSVQAEFLGAKQPKKMSSTSLDPKAMESAAIKRDLDLTINQRLNVNFTDREAGGQEHARKSLAMVEKDISSFARFLSQNLCLEVLLFWKEVEQFKTMFSAEERVALFSKIYDLYCVPGAQWQVNFKGEHVNQMQKCFSADGKLADDVDEEIFDAAQTEVRRSCCCRPHECRSRHRMRQRLVRQRRCHS